MPHVPLPDRSVIAVEGADAAMFLQGIITANVETLEPGQMRGAALLTPQGKILFEFLLSTTPDGYRLDVRRDDGEALLKRLMLYRLRARVTLEERPETAIAAGWGPAPNGASLDRRFPAGAGVWRHYGALPEGEVAATDEWTTIRIENGVAELGTDYQGADAFPHDVLFDLNGGVDFRKGCYVGQEVVSRMQHRGTSRRRPVILATTPGETIASGAAVLAGHHTAGTVGSVSGHQALAIVRTDRIADALTEGTQITVADRVVTPKLPGWTGLAFEQKSGD